MTRIAKNGRSIWHFLRRLLVSLLAGALFLGLVGSIIALAASVSQRANSPEDLVAGFLHHWESHDWYNNPQFAWQVSDLEITRRHTLDEVKLVRLEYSWQLSRSGKTDECKGALLAQEYADIFGGWRRVGNLNSYCGEHFEGLAFPHAFWESLPLELPHYFYFYVSGRHARAAQVEAVLVDGSSERVDVVEQAYALLVRREAPFQVEKLNFIDEKGDAFTKRKWHY